MSAEFDIDYLAGSAYRVLKNYFDINTYYPGENQVVFTAGPTLNSRGWKRELSKRLAGIRAHATIEREGGQYRITVKPLEAGIGFPPLLNSLLFILTFLTVLVAASFREVGSSFLKEPTLLVKGLPFTITLLIILVVHEMGHFIAGARRGVIMSYPFFIPAPNFLGTFGALIKTRTPIANRNDLILIGAAGPLAGALPALLALVFGYTQSTFIPRAVGPDWMLGNSLITLAVQHLTIGATPLRFVIDHSPISLAGQVGLLVTMLNLLPLGQLDGGHVIYGLFGRWQRALAMIFLAFLLFLGFNWHGWWIWMILAVLIRPFHPPVFYDTHVPDRKHRVIGWVAVILFVLTFVPIPIS
jgi:hypothetical protein